MIAVEIRNDELRAILVSGMNGKKTGRANSVPVPFDVLSNFISGNIMSMTDLLNELLLGLNIGDYKKQKYSVTINLESIMAHKVQTPQVKDKQLVYSVSSALVRDNITISSDQLVTYAVIKGTSKKAYDINAYILDRTIAKAVINLFAHFKLELKQIDVSPNTIIKAFSHSGYSKTDKPLTLVVDLSEEEVRYYQFVEKSFTFTYLDRTESNYSDSMYADAFENNVYQFLDEFSNYTLQDLDIVLMGDEELINKIVLNFEGIFLIKKFFDEFKVFDTGRTDNINKYVNSLGALIRRENSLSSSYKYDVNVLREIRERQGKSNSNSIKNIVVLGTLATVAFGGWNAYNFTVNNKIAEENQAIRNYVESPGVKEELAKKEGLVQTLSIYNDALDTLETIESFLVANKKPYSSRAYYSITQDVPLGSEVKSTTYRDGLVEINFETSRESDFKDYVTMLGKNKLVQSVEYTGFSSSGAGYQGQIKVQLKGSVKE